MATESAKYRSVRVKPEVTELIEEIRTEITRRGVYSIRDQRTRERALLLEHVGVSDVVRLALELLKDHVQVETKLGRGKKRG